MTTTLVYNLKEFRKEFSGAPYDVKEFAETVVMHLRDDTPAAVKLTTAAVNYLRAEVEFAQQLVRTKIDIG